jgi:hypothetical protein
MDNLEALVMFALTFIAWCLVIYAMGMMLSAW